MSDLRLLTLGTPRLERDGVPLELRYRKNLALITYLAVTGQRHTREALLALLWPEREPRRARVSLRRNLSLLRKALAGQVLLVERETVGIDPEAALWLDVGRFRRLLSAWRGHGHPEDEVCAECLTSLGEAVALYRGDFMSGFSLRDSLAFDEWQFFQTEELRHELASALERLVRGHSAQSAYESALTYARRWLALDPLHEPAHRHLMTLYAQTGQRAAALRQYQECVRVLEAELGLSPSRETTALYERLRVQPTEREVSPVPAVPPRHNLPAQTTPFVGRDALLAEIAARLRDPDCRLLSLVGPGGIGKTRLALEAVREEVDRFRDGVYWVSLSALRSIDEAVAAVGHIIGLALYRASDPWQQLLNHLRDRHLLLVLDNLEHLLEAPSPTGRSVVDLVDRILQEAPDVTIVTTSRARPNVQSECLVSVSGMDYPTLKAAPGPATALGRAESGASARPSDWAQVAGQFDAVKLFLATARRVRPGFAPTAKDWAEVAQICELVQGMPLAILLAAAWIEMLSPAEIVAELGRGYGLLETDLRDVPERQRSVEAVFDASWRMLDDAERQVFARLSVFRGGFTRDAAHEVAGAGLRVLMSLIHKSCLQRDSGGRYRIHSLLGQYAEVRLAEDLEEKERVSDLHSQYYARMLRHEMASANQGERTQRFLLEQDNLQAGWRWAVSQARFAEIPGYTGLFYFYLTQGWYREAVSSLEWAAGILRTCWAQDAANRAGGVALGLIQIMRGFTNKAYAPGQRIAARDDLVAEGVSILRRLGARRELAEFATWVVYGYSPERGAEAWEVVQASLAFYRELGDLEGVLRLLPLLVALSVRREAYDEAERYCQEAIALGEQVGSRGAIHAASKDLAQIAYYRGEYTSARQFYEDDLPSMEESGQKSHLARHLGFLGDIALAMGDYERARECHQRAWALYDEMSVDWGEGTAGEHYGVAYSLDRLGEVALALGAVEQARRAYRQALLIARDDSQTSLHLDVVVSQAALLAGEGQGERAAELSALVLHHPASHADVRRKAQDLLDALAGKLAPGALAAAQKRRQARDLEATLRELLAELQDER